MTYLATFLFGAAFGAGVCFLVVFFDGTDSDDLDDLCDRDPDL